MKTKQHMLAAVPMFSGLDSKELESLAALCTEVVVETGYVLTKQGSVAYECFIVVNGSASVDCDGHIVAHLGPGECIGELALLDHGPRSATVTATTGMTLMVLNSREFSTMLSEVPSLANRLLTTLSNRVRQSSKLVNA
jgi:CRP/FNR family transcriptional regulator, cyclic AMP receptor protein